MADPLSRDELEEAIGKMKSGKTAGQSSILPEMVKVLSYDDSFLSEVVQAVWSVGNVPKDWVDAVLVPIPKKGDLNSCDNWRGITLLDVVGKIVARLLKRDYRNWQKMSNQSHSVASRRKELC